MIELPNVRVLMSPELVEQLGTWSVPVQVRVVRVGNKYEVETRTHTCAPPDEVVTRVLSGGRATDDERAAVARIVADLLRDHA